MGVCVHAYVCLCGLVCTKFNAIVRCTGTLQCVDCTPDSLLGGVGKEKHGVVCLSEYAWVHECVGV